jgi:sugar phosphate isomerase/epimerase
MTSRRSFIQKASLLSAALYLRPSDLFFKGKPIGLQLFTLRIDLSKKPLETLQKVAELGYKELETFGYNQGKWFGMTASEFSKVLKDLGMSSPSGHTFPGGMFLQSGWEDKWKKATADAKALGQEFIVIPWLEEPHRKSIDNYKKIAAGLGNAALIAKDAGLQLAYHNHDFEFNLIEGQRGMDILLNETDASMVKIELDLYWAVKAGEDPLAMFESHPGRFSMWHIKDMDRTERKFFTEVGNGVIDFKSIFAKAKKSGMKHFFVEQDECPGSPMDSIAKSISYLKGNIVK